MTISTERRFLIYNFLDTPVAEREMSTVQFRKKHNLPARIWRNIVADNELDKKETKRKKEAELSARTQIDRELQRKPRFEYDSKAYLRSRSQEVDEALLEACKKGNANALKVYKQILGELVEKSPIEVKIYNATDHFEAYREAEQRVSKLRRGAQRDISLQPRPVLLSKEIRVDTEQEHSQDG